MLQQKAHLHCRCLLVDIILCWYVFFFASWQCTVRKLRCAQSSVGCAGLEPSASGKRHWSKTMGQSRVTDGFHSLPPFRFLQNNQLTELPPGAFVSLSSLLVLYVPFSFPGSAERIYSATRFRWMDIKKALFFFFFFFFFFFLPSSLCVASTSSFL